MLGIFLINRVTCQEVGFDMDFEDEHEKGSDFVYPSFKFEGKSFLDGGI